MKFLNALLNKTFLCLIFLVFSGNYVGRAQTYLGLQTGIYTGYLGRVTNPGWGFVAGLKKPLGENVHVLIQLSYLQNRANDPVLPLYTGEITADNVDNTSLVYFRKMNFNMTYSNLDICFSLLKRERLDLALTMGSGFSFCHLGAERIRAHVEGDPARKWDFFFGVGLDFGASCEYLINDKLTWRVGINSMLTTSLFQESRIARFALCSGFILHQ